MARNDPAKRPSICPVPWIDGRRGYLVDWVTQLWVRMKRQEIDLREHAWLVCPAGETHGIGADFFEGHAEREGLLLAVNEPGIGLFDSLSVMGALADRVSPAVRHFYEHTSEYELDLWSQWCGAFRPFGWMLSFTFGRRLQQLNVPVSPLDTARGITSDLITMSDPKSGKRVLTGWLRTFRVNNQVLYVGLYSHCTNPQGEHLVRVAFPLPNGNAIVVMRPTVGEDGSLLLASAGKGFGDAGFYFTVRRGEHRSAVRYLKAMKETIHVYEGSDGLHADHVLRLFGITFLRMHYRLRRRSL